MHLSGCVNGTYKIFDNSEMKNICNYPLPCGGYIELNYGHGKPYLIIRQHFHSLYGDLSVDSVCLKKHEIEILDKVIQQYKMQI